MHLTLTDRLACPRCGPAHGLILLADRLEDRSVRDGHLGCPNCRDRFPVREGIADLRPPPRGADGPAARDREGSDAEEALPVAAALGLTEGGGFVLLIAVRPSLAAQLDALVPEVGAVLAATDAGSLIGGGTAGSRLRFEGILPLQSRSMRGVVLGRGAPATLVEEAARVLGSGGRLLVLDPSAEHRRAMMAAGLGVVLGTGEALVGARR